MAGMRLGETEGFAWPEPGEDIGAWFARVPARPRWEAPACAGRAYLGRMLREILDRVTALWPRYAFLFDRRCGASGVKHGEYFLHACVSMWYMERCGGVVYDEEENMFRAALMALIDRVVDDPALGLEDAFAVGLHVFDLGPAGPWGGALGREIARTRAAVAGVASRKELLEFMLGVGRIEREVQGTAGGAFLAARLRSGAACLRGLGGWPADGFERMTFPAVAASMLADDFVDLSCDEVRYLHEGNVGAMADRLAECLRMAWSQTLGRGAPVCSAGGVAAAFEAIAREALRSPASVEAAKSGGVRYFAACVSAAAAWCLAIRHRHY